MAFISGLRLIYCALLIGGVKSSKIEETNLAVAVKSDKGLNSHGEDLDPVPLPVAEVYLASENENLTLLSKDGNSEILISDEMLRNGKEFQNLVLVCNAFFPIRWIYQGDGAPTRMYSSEIRTLRNFEDESSYEYFTTLVLMPERVNEHMTGTYVCESVDDPGSRVFYHLYFPGRFGFPTIRNRVVRIPVNETQVTIPCMATNPNLSMSLYKIFPKEEARSWTNDTAVSYSPKLGYTVDLTKIVNPYGTYYCSLNHQFSFWKIELVPSVEEDVQIQPNSRLVKQENFKSQTFICRSKEKLKFTFPNSHPIGEIQYGYEESERFAYFGTLTTDTSIPIGLKYLKINCVTQRSNRILHSWEFSSIGEEELSIKYDKSSERILCCSKSGLSPTYDFVKCETKTDCGIKRSCFTNGRCEHPFPSKLIDAPAGCVGLEFPERVPTHVGKCSVGDISRTMAITENAARNDIVLDEGEKIPPTDLILKLTAIMNDKPEVKFKCTGSLYYFSANFVFALEKSDGTMEYAASESIEMPESHEPVLKTKMDSSVRRVVCFAPLALSSEWRNVSMPVLISEPVKSKATQSLSTMSRGAFIRRRYDTRRTR